MWLLDLYLSSTLTTRHIMQIHTWSFYVLFIKLSWSYFQYFWVSLKIYSWHLILNYPTFSPCALSPGGHWTLASLLLAACHKTLEIRDNLDVAWSYWFTGQSGLHWMPRKIWLRGRLKAIPFAWMQWWIALRKVNNGVTSSDYSVSLGCLRFVICWCVLEQILPLGKCWVCRIPGSNRMFVCSLNLPLRSGSRMLGRDDIEEVDTR